MKKTKILFTLIGLIAVLTACGKDNKQEVKEAKSGELTKVTIGASETPHGELIKALEPEFKKEGIDLDLVVFSDYVQPNLQLESGDLDLNFYQHQPYLDSFNKDRKTNIVSLENSKIFITPLLGFSSKVKDIKDLEDGAEIIIPNDPTNGARALLILDKEGLIKLKDKNNLNSTEVDIVENPKNLKFTAVDAQNIPRVYQDADLAFINPNFNSNFTIGGVCFSKTIIDIRSQCLQRNGSLAVELSTSDISTAQTTRTAGLDTHSTRLHGSAHAGLHCTSEGYTVLQLLSNVLSYQLCISVRSLDLFNVNHNLLIG